VVLLLSMVLQRSKPEMERRGVAKSLLSNLKVCSL
jgi:hypothetical protein